MSRDEQRGVATWIEKAILALLFVFAAFAPHSIAITQGAWLLGMAVWVARFAFYPRPRLLRTPVDYALLGFFILTGISAILSYEPIVSFGKVRAAALFTIVYLVAENVRSLRLVRLLALTLICSSLIGVLAVTGRQILGEGIRVEGVRPESPLSAATLLTRAKGHLSPIVSGDTVLEVDGIEISSPEELAAALAADPKAQPAQLKIFRLEWTPTLEVERGRLLPGSTLEEQLGISGWSRGRDSRAHGFFGHFTTYAETLQLIASLTLGLLLMQSRKLSRQSIWLAVAFTGLVWALALTLTRASWAALLISAGLMFFLSRSRRALLIFLAGTILLVIAGAMFLQQRRTVGFLDLQDLSTTWRLTVWREGVELLLSKPRHLLVGVGMDSLKAHWREWGLFDGGRLPLGHMHSNPLQLALERGVPALLVWLWLLAAYARMLFSLWRQKKRTVFDKEFSKVATESIPLQGIVLGALGGTVGFFTSGLVHYNWGDSEVMMIFYLIMGMTLVIAREFRHNEPQRP